MTPYECVHVPVEAARVRVFGVPLWVLPVAALVVAVGVYGPWVILAPVLVVVLVVAVALVVAVGRHDRSAAEAAGDGAVPVVVTVPTSSPQGPGSVSGRRPVCLGCQARAAVGFVEIEGYRIPACGPCLDVARTGVPSGLPGPAARRELT